MWPSDTFNDTDRCKYTLSHNQKQCTREILIISRHFYVVIDILIRVDIAAAKISPERAPEERTAPPALRTGAAEKAEAPAMAAQRMAARSIASKTDWFSFLPRLYESIFLTKNLGPPEGKLRKCADCDVKMGFEDSDVKMKILM
jgi:hypothetical protein